MPPFHVCTAAQADLDDLAGGLGSHAPTIGREEDGYDGPSVAAAEKVPPGVDPGYEALQASA